MPTLSMDNLITLSMLGFVGLMVGGIQLALARIQRAWRVGLSMAVGTGFAVSVAWLLEDRGLGLLAGTAVLLMVGTSYILSKGWLQQFAAKLLPISQSVFWAPSLLVFMGLLTILGSVAWSEYSWAMKLQEDDNFCSWQYTVPEFRDTPAMFAKTDRGTKISIKVPTDDALTKEPGSQERQFLEKNNFNNNLIRRGDSGMQTNCHGWVYTGGKFWVQGVMVPEILEGNRYRVVTEPNVNDLVIYRDATGAVAHTGIVRYKSPGQPLLVESKWGAMGIYLHEVTDSPYGQDYQFYHSDRVGHLLNDLPEPSGIADR